MLDDFYLIPILPEIFLALCALGLLLVGVKQGNEASAVISWASAAAVGISAFIMMSFIKDWNHTTVLNSMFVFDEFAAMMKLLVMIGLVASIALSVHYLKQEQLFRFEYPVLMLLAGIGMLLMVSANNMLTLYMGLELQSLSLYILAAFQRNSIKSAEAGVKYFVLGALSSGMLLFGISMIYGFTGSLDFQIIAQNLHDLNKIPVGASIGLVFIIAAFAFKVSAVPFHMWTPDVYQGAPASVTAFFAIVPKVAAFAILVRLLLEPFGAMQDQWVQIIYFISVASMIVGAFAGIAQENIKRLLAYSSIGNMGYALIGLVAGTESGIGAVVLYLMIYMIMTAGVFALVLCMRRDGLAVHKISDLSGLSKTSPYMAYLLAIFMFSMTGLPPLAGFFGKLVIFQAAVEAEYYVLAVVGLLTSVVAAYYYLRIVKVMFFDDAIDPLETTFPMARRVVATIAAIFVLGFIFNPDLFVSSSLSAAYALF